MLITASEARTSFRSSSRLTAFRAVVEIIARRRNAVLMSADDYAALAETAKIYCGPRRTRGV